jgi:hypothetical protein
MGVFGKLRRGVLSAVRGAVKKTGKAIEFVSRVGSTCVRSTTKVAGLGLSGLGKVCGGDGRFGEVVANVGDACATFVETKVKAGVVIARQTVNYSTQCISLVIGDEEGAIEAERECDMCNEEMKNKIQDFGKSLVKAWDTFTATTAFKETKAYYESVISDRKRQQRSANDKINVLNKKIMKDLDLINTCRRKSKQQFSRFEKVSAAIAEWEIHEYVVRDFFDPVSITIPPALTRSRVFEKCDFDDDPFSTNIKAFLTAGWWTEAKMKEARTVIDGMVKAQSEEFMKASAEIGRWNRVHESLDLIANSFADFVAFYEELIDELEYAISLLRISRYRMDLECFSDSADRINLYFLPDRHLKCLMACDKMSRILCEMSKRKYLSVGKSEVCVSKEEFDAFKKNRDEEYAQLKEKMAA